MATFEWFRCRASDWENDAVAALDFAEVGFLHILRIAMIERAEPISKEVAYRLGRQRKAARKTVDRLLAKLAEAGLIVIAEAGIWCDVAADEMAFREGKSKSLSERNRKTSQKRWEKTKQNQSNAMPDREEDIEGCPTGIPSNIHTVESPCGPIGADAPRPTADKDANDGIHEGCNHRGYDEADEASEPVYDVVLDSFADDDPEYLKARKSLSDAWDNDRREPAIMTPDAEAAWRDLVDCWDDDRCDEQTYAGGVT